MKNTDPERPGHGIPGMQFYECIFFSVMLEAFLKKKNPCNSFSPDDYDSFLKMSLFAKYILGDCLKQWLFRERVHCPPKENI